LQLESCKNSQHSFEYLTNENKLQLSEPHQFQLNMEFVKSLKTKIFSIRYGGVTEPCMFSILHALWTLGCRSVVTK